MQDLYLFRTWWCYNRSYTKGPLQIDDFQARSADELSLARGDQIELIERDDDFGDGWYLGKHLQDGRTGLFPEGSQPWLDFYVLLSDRLSVYTKLDTRSPPQENGTRVSRSTSSPPASANPPTTNIMSVLNQENIPSEQPPAYHANQNTSFQASSPAPLNTPTSMQRAVSAPTGGFPPQPLAKVPNSQRSISMVMDDKAQHSEESPVMNETLSVIDEHITDMNTPRSSLLASARRNTNDSASEYSSHADHRLSYITGNETDEEEANALTKVEVLRWTPDQVAQYLLDLGVEQKHCEIFKEQEISGEVLLNIDKDSIFMKEFELGPVGRRLATWHKIKSFQDGIRSTRERQRTITRDEEGSVVGSVGGSASVSQTSTNGSALAKVPHTMSRSATLRHSRQNSPRIISEPQVDIDGEYPGVPKIYSTDNTARPSAATIRDYNHHHRRHSSIDVSKSDASSSLHTTTGPTPPTSPYSSSHKKIPSFDRNWTMSAFPPANSPGPARASAMLGLSALGMTGPALPAGADRHAITPNAESGNPLDQFDRGYLSSGEAETRKNRNVLRKNHPASASHSRQNSHKEGSISKRHSRFGSAGSIMEAISSVTGTNNRKTSSDALKARARTQSLRDTNSSMATLPSNSTNSSSTPIVTKLDYSESPTSLNSKSNPVSPATKSEGFAPLAQVTNKLRTSLRSNSETTAGSNDKNLIASPVFIPPPIKESPLQSPSRTDSTANSAASKSFDFDPPGNGTNKMVTIVPATRTPSLGTKKAKNKKETSAYKSLMVLSPQKALETCSHSGWMHKKSAKMTSAFKSRFFVLRDKRLSYYYSLDDKIEKGLIDINSHRVMFVENDVITSLYATLAGTKSNPNSPANAPSTTENENDDPETNLEKVRGGPFFFKLVPPRTGLSKAVQFTRPAVHYFAVDNYKEGREWFLALKKASIDRDETQPVTSTYSQKTISLEKAKAMKQRPPALMSLPGEEEEGSRRNSRGSSSKSGTGGNVDSNNNPGLQIDGLEYNYMSSPHQGGISENGTTPESSVPNSAARTDEEARIRPQSDEALGKMSRGGSSEAASTLRMVRSMSGGLSTEVNRNDTRTPLMHEEQTMVPEDMAPLREEVI